MEHYLNQITYSSNYIVIHCVTYELILQTRPLINLKNVSTPMCLFINKENIYGKMVCFLLHFWQVE